MFTPTKNPETILAGFSPLEAMLLQHLQEQGLDFDQVEFSVGDNYQVVGEGLASGSIDVGFIPAGTYIEFSDQNVEAILTALHPQVSITSEDPKVWNEQKPTTITDGMTDKYQSIIVAGNTKLGKNLANFVNQNQPLSKSDLINASWCLGDVTSSSSYIYPANWLMTNFGLKVDELKNVLRFSGYGDLVNSLNSGVCDIGAGYADFRYDYQDSWSGDIWQDTNVIGVSQFIPYDTISVSRNSQNINDQVIASLENFFMNLNTTKEGMDAMKTLNQLGYVKPNLALYKQEEEIMEKMAI